MPKRELIALKLQKATASPFSQPNAANKLHEIVLSKRVSNTLKNRTNT